MPLGGGPGDSGAGRDVARGGLGSLLLGHATRRTHHRRQACAEDRAVAVGAARVGEPDISAEPSGHLTSERQTDAAAVHGIRIQARFRPAGEQRARFRDAESRVRDGHHECVPVVEQLDDRPTSVHLR